MKPRYKLMTVSPKKAQGWLDDPFNGANRHLSVSRVNTYAAQMANGEWEATNQGIAISSEGQLVDGQHRCAAVVQYGKPVEMLVAFGVNNRAAIDIGKARTPGDYFRLDLGRANANAEAAICRQILQLSDKDIGVGEAPVRSALRNVLDTYQAQVDDFAIGPARARIPAPVRAVAAVMAHFDKKVGRRFFDGIAIGADLAADDPRLHLRAWLGTRATNSPAPIWTRAIATADAFINGDKLSRLLGSAEQRYPRFAETVGVPINQSLLALVSQKTK